jgi:hypothetical protein
MNPRRPKRVIRIEVSVQKGEVVCVQDKAFDVVLLAEDEQRGFGKERAQGVKQAKDNAEKRKNGIAANGGEYLYVRDQGSHAHEPHATIHLFSGPADEIEWFSNDNTIDFTVHIQRNPELILLSGLTAASTPVPLDRDSGIDNLFQKDFPLKSSKGAAVNSGRMKDNPAVFEQRYYKYSVEVEGSVPFDPDVEGHFGD